jgi:hypothetical protein
MSARHMNVALVALTSVGLALGVRLAEWPLVRPVLPRGPTARTAVPAVGAVPRGARLAETLVARDPFRLTRRPARLAYQPVPLVRPGGPPAPSPVLVLAGIVWDGGNDPAALIEGFPGIVGARSVHRGDVIAGLRVKRIAAGAVVIVGLDTTWTLTVREPWR